MSRFYSPISKMPKTFGWIIEATVICAIEIYSVTALSFRCQITGLFSVIDPPLRPPSNPHAVHSTSRTTSPHPARTNKRARVQLLAGPVGFHGPAGLFPSAAASYVDQRICIALCRGGDGGTSGLLIYSSTSLGFSLNSSGV